MKMVRFIGALISTLLFTAPIVVATAAQDIEILSPMTSTVLRVYIKEGDIVRPNEPLLTIECMKMVMTFNSDRAGSIAYLNVNPGGSVTRDQVLLRISPRFSPFLER